MSLDEFVDGKTLRNIMLENASAMLKPARRIMNISRKELAAISGLDESLIEAVEEGRTTLQKSHYLALASVFDSVKYTGGKDIFLGLVRLLIPDIVALHSNWFTDVTFSRTWCETFYGYDGSIDGHEISGDDPELERVADLPDFEAGFREKDIDSDSAPDLNADDDYDDIGLEAIPGERLPDSELEDIAANCKIIADASAIRDENFPAMVTRLEPLLRQADAIIIVPQKAVDELQERISTTRDENEKLNISDALKYIARKGNEGLIKIRSYEFEGDSTDVIGEVFDRYSGEYDFMLITQDALVFRNIVSGREYVNAAHINDKGDLILWTDDVVG